MDTAVDWDCDGAESLALVFCGVDARLALLSLELEFAPVFVVVRFDCDLANRCSSAAARWFRAAAAAAVSVAEPPAVDDGGWVG